jgi:cytochrome o ubiquinol oxidase subunit 2
MRMIRLLAALPGGVLDPQGPVGAADRQIMLNALAIMLAIVVPTLVAALAFAWWFRASNGRARRRPQWVYSGRIELLVWSIPLLTIVFLGGVIWIGSHRLDPYRPIDSPVPPLEVQVVSMDWKWLFIYPVDGVASVNELVVPVGVPVHFALTSDSVMNAFFVPQLGSMVATMNGMVTQLNLQADRAGDYLGESTQFSGDGFSGMAFVVRAVPPQGFEQWKATAREAGRVLDRAAYEALARESANAPPSVYRAVEPGLFHAVATRQIGPGGGARSTDGNPQVRPEHRS